DDGCIQWSYGTTNEPGFNTGTSIHKSVCFTYHKNPSAPENVLETCKQPLGTNGDNIYYSGIIRCPDEGCFVKK
ncbi:36741_t:CDS:1, partial [Racocetra persica]